jgi:cytochrome c oxidase accessory protein FixG
MQIQESSLPGDGSRKRIIPADVRGRFATGRRAGFVLLISLWIVLPWIKIADHPALFLDIEKRAFYIFGLSFNAQDVWLLFFLLTGIVFLLVYVTALFGRVFCGFACPQTVFLEGVFRPIERLILGSREQRLRGVRVWQTVLTHCAFVLASLAIAHLVLGYFVSLSGLFRMMRQNPSEHPEAFVWTAAITALMYFNFGWFREQFCVVMCPYGRLQSALIDSHSLVVGYDGKRGEPRGKNGKTEGDCVDCKRCVVVCPTGIDIRNGLQMDCIGCTACIDACDDIMDRLKRPRGLIRYDSEEGFAKKPTLYLRPRTYLYTALLGIGATLFVVALQKRDPFEANLLRLPGAPYVLTAESIQNLFEVHLVNKEGHAEHYALHVDVPKGYRATLSQQSADVPAQRDTHIPLFVSVCPADFTRDTPFSVVVTATGSSVSKRFEATFLGSKGAIP